MMCFSQKIDKIINSAEVGKIEKKLSADDMAGRKTFSPEIDNAASLIAKEFKKNKLQFFGNSYFQKFSMIKTTPLQSVLILNNDTVAANKYFAYSSAANLNYTATEGFDIVRIGKGDNYSKTIQSVIGAKKNTLVLIDTSYAERFKRLTGFLSGARFASPVEIIFIVTTVTNPTGFKLAATNEIS